MVFHDSGNILFLVEMFRSCAIEVETQGIASLRKQEEILSLPTLLVVFI